MKPLPALACLFALTACGGGKELPVVVTVDAALTADLQALAKAKVWFGHQSVGANLVQGLQALAAEAKVELHLEEALIGQNRDPASKFAALVARATATPDDGLQLMAMKLCYVDIGPDTDVERLFEDYRKAVAAVQHARPGVRVLHITPPLNARATGIGAGLRRLFGRTVWEDDGNARRAAFAERLRQAFAGEPCFDLEAIESTAPDGSRCTTTVGGKTVPCLWPGYTDDGGHLNQAGQRVAARAFARAVAAALANKAG